MTTKTTTKTAPIVTVTIVTEQIKKGMQPRTLEVPKGTRVNKHYNGDNSITLYAKGVKIFRSAGDEQIEAGEVAEDYDADEAVEKFLKKWFGKKEYVFGKTTYGHNWKNKKKAEATAAEAPAPKAKRTRKAKVEA